MSHFAAPSQSHFGSTHSMPAGKKRKVDESTADDGSALLAVRIAVGGLCDKQHAAECPNRRDCARCKWIASQSTWKQKFPWLDAQFRIEGCSSKWGVGCKQCAEVQRSRPHLFEGLMVHRHHFARYEIQSDLRVQRFQKHQDSPAHQIASAAFSKGMAAETSPGEVDESMAAPSYEEWKAVLHEPGLGVVSSVGGLGKCRMMRWCLAAAHRRALKEKIQDAVTISIQQDMRGNRFLLRFRLVTPSLEILTGTVGLRKHVPSLQAPGSDGLREATMSCIKEFCSKDTPPNYGGLRVAQKVKGPAEVDEDLHLRLCQRIEAFAADSAADEQLAARELQGGPLAGPSIPPILDSLSQFLSNLKAREGFSFAFSFLAHGAGR